MEEKQLKIPKKIHYCWFGGKSLPENVRKCIRSWTKHCPDYELIQWNETNFDIECHPFVKAAYDAGAWAFVSDYARLKVIYENGGIYLDTDVELLKNPEFLLAYDFYIGVQQGEHLCNTGLGFGAVRSSPVVRKMLDVYEEINYTDSRRKEIACPWLNSQVMTSLGYMYTDSPVEIDGIMVLPCRYLDPCSTGKSKNLLCDDTISIHHYSASWMPFSVKIKRRIANFIGVDAVLKIKKILRRSK